MDVMEKALQEILPGNSRNESAHRLEIVEHDDIDSTDSRRSEQTVQVQKSNQSSNPAPVKNVTKSANHAIAIVGFRRTQNISPCVAHIRAEVSHVAGTVKVEACLSHYGHELDRVPRPPDCVLGRLRQQMQTLSRSEIENQLPSWTKHDLTETTWRNLESQTPSTSSLFAQFRSLLKRTFEHIAVISRSAG